MQVCSRIAIGLALFGLTAAAMPEGRGIDAEVARFGGARGNLIDNEYPDYNVLKRSGIIGQGPISGLAPSSENCALDAIRGCYGNFDLFILREGGREPFITRDEIQNIWRRGESHGADSLMSLIDIGSRDGEGQPPDAGSVAAFFTPEWLDFTLRFEESLSRGGALDTDTLDDRSMLAGGSSVTGFGAAENEGAGEGIVDIAMFTKVPEVASLILIFLGLLGLNMSRRAFH